MEDFPQRPGHMTPAWVPSGALYHIRIRAGERQAIPLSDTVLSAKLLASAERYHALGRWWCELFLLMPDHIHALIRFPPEPGMAHVIRDWKRGATRFHGVGWQENFFDHRIRHAKEGLEKWHYIRRNPVVKGLCPREEDWPHAWAPPPEEEAR